MRDEHRRQLIEKIGSQVVQKVENTVSAFYDQHVDQGQSKK